MRWCHYEHCACSYQTLLSLHIRNHFIFSKLWNSTIRSENRSYEKLIDKYLLHLSIVFALFFCDVFSVHYFLNFILKMGVRGLMSFLEKANHMKQVNVCDEIRNWIRWVNIFFHIFYSIEHVMYCINIKFNWFWIEQRKSGSVTNHCFWFRCIDIPWHQYSRQYLWWSSWSASGKFWKTDDQIEGNRCNIGFLFVFECNSR